MKTFRLFKFQNVGPNANYAKFPKILTKGQNVCDQTVKFSQ